MSPRLFLSVDFVRLTSTFCVAVGLCVLVGLLTFVSPSRALDVKIDGSSTVYLIAEAMAEEFQSEYRGRHRITVGISGTGGGFKKFCRGDTHISNASRPIKASEREVCAQAGIKYLELPVAFDAIAVAINPENTWALSGLTVEELRRIWEPEADGEILSWNQIRPNFPKRPISLFGPGVDSGTFDYFTEAIVGDEGASRSDYTASEDDNIIVVGVSGEVGALGYFGLAYLKENSDRLNAVPIIQDDGTPVLPSVQTVETNSYQPLSRPIFIYVNAQAAQENGAVRLFVEQLLDPSYSADLIGDVGYVPLPDEVYRLVLENFQSGRTGTVFAQGSQTGVTIADLITSARQD